MIFRIASVVFSIVMLVVFLFAISLGWWLVAVPHLINISVMVVVTVVLVMFIVALVVDIYQGVGKLINTT